MPDATLQTVVSQASAVYLNDAAQQIWTTAALLPHFQEAYRDLLLILWVNGMPIIREKSSKITVPANTASLATAVGGSLLPNDLFEPIWLKERAAGATAEQFVPMVESDFEPDYTSQMNVLKYWIWRKEDIWFIHNDAFSGSSTPRDILIQYYRQPPIPQLVTDSLNFLFAEMFLSPQTAGYAAGSVGNVTRATELLWVQNQNIGLAGAKLDILIRANIKGQQNLPARRVPYRRFARSRLLL